MILLSLNNWEDCFSLTLQGVKQKTAKSKTGILLPIIPNHTKWSDYLNSIKTEWSLWQKNLPKYPSCLLILYAGLAFYEYDENTFWPKFSDSIGIDPLPVSQQQAINREFARVANDFGLMLKNRHNGTDYVGSAVNYIGIPLSLWDGFLDICEWALWRQDWKTLSDEEWKEVIEKHTGGRHRLTKFLIDNREIARSFIQEMIDAREFFTQDPSLTIENIAQVSILRTEYFDEVPETAEFLRPKDPDSLFQNRARLIWNEHRKQICLQLPGLEEEKLPATWRIGEKSQAASHAPDEITLNHEAFHDPLLLTLESENGNETQRLRGVLSWGLFDLESGGRHINSDRNELPLKSYLLISQSEIEIHRKGFAEDENPTNEPFELADCSPCFVTHLWPTGKYAEVRLNEAGQTERVIHFKTRNRIEARFFIGQGYKAAYFTRMNPNKIKMDHLPILCVTIPNGYFKDNNTELKKIFKVMVDGEPALGQWKCLDVEAPSNDREFYQWWWNQKPFLERKVGFNKLTSFGQLHEAFKSPDLRGNRTISVEAPPYIRVKFDVEIVQRSKNEIGQSWKNLPGAFLPMFLLCQSTEGMKWEDLILTKDVIAPRLRLSQYLLHKYERQGFLVQRGHRWFFDKSRAELKPSGRDQCQMNFCGDPSILWGLYRRMNYQTSSFPPIKIIDKRGEVPYLRIDWPRNLQSKIEQYLKDHQVVVGANLWTH